MAIRDWFGFGEPYKREEYVPVIQAAAHQEAEERAFNPALLPPSRTTISLTPKEVYKIGTVYRSINIISTMISQMELKVYRGEKVVKTIPAVVKSPIAGESQTSFIQQVIWSLALWGNCYIRLYGDPVSSVEVLDPELTFAWKDEKGVLRYRHGDKDIPANRIRHLKFERIPGEINGIGPLTGAKGEIEAAYLLDKFQKKWFDTTGVPKGLLKVPGAFNSAESATFIEAWNKFVSGHAGNVVLPQGMDYQTVNAKPVEVQYHDLAEANIRNIARIFGIPASNLLSAIDGTSMTYTNYIEANIQFMQNTLSRYMKEIEDFFDSILPGSARVRFNEEDLLRLSPEKLWTVKKMQSEVGYYSGAEQRKEEGKKPLPEKPVDTEAEKNTPDNEVK